MCNLNLFLIYSKMFTNKILEIKNKETKMFNLLTSKRYQMSKRIFLYFKKNVNNVLVGMSIDEELTWLFAFFTTVSSSVNAFDFFFNLFFLENIFSQKIICLFGVYIL